MIGLAKVNEERLGCYLQPVFKKFEGKGFEFEVEGNGDVNVHKPDGDIIRMTPSEFDMWLWGAYDARIWFDPWE